MKLELDPRQIYSYTTEMTTRQIGITNIFNKKTCSYADITVARKAVFIPNNKTKNE